MYQIYAKFTVKDDSTDEVLAVLGELIDETRREPGNISYQLFQSTGDPTILTVFEQWKDQEAIDAHNASAHFNKALTALEPYHAAPPVIEVYTLVR
ncbi:MAG: antibiotic biosynthesis monooxygenase [Coriobacteriales bacterium]|jgi:quinol monooxygenase YgiN|nr:antibiotic biosynthesis monooxygenase [Coriobacteriales bacterium]